MDIVTGRQSPEEKILAKFLSKNLIFIVDPSAASRRRLMKTLSELGAITHMIQTYGHYEEAEQAMEEKAPAIVLTDYNLGHDKSGFDLLQTHRKIHEKSISLFILITANSSQSLVAQAAEEDIDSFILKPYTINTIKETLLNIWKFYIVQYYILRPETYPKILSHVVADQIPPGFVLYNIKICCYRRK